MEARADASRTLTSLTPQSNGSDAGLPRLFKACRTCRSQKSRCIGARDGPCQRCRATGRECVFDQLGSKKRTRQDTEDLVERARNSRGRYEDLEDELSKLRRVVNRLTAAPGSTNGKEHNVDQQTTPSSASQRSSIAQLTSRITSMQQDFAAVEDSSCLGSLDLQHINAPITAVHAMAPRIASSLSSSSQSNREYSSQGHTDFDKQALSCPEIHSDIISRGLLSESTARRLFYLYMAGANNFLPLFDPIGDAFETLRKRSTFCFTVILAIALGVDNILSGTDRLVSDCLREAHHLAAKSLFISSPELGTVQGMILLAAYSERNWFAITHARQLAEDLGLDKAVQCLLDDPLRQTNVGRQNAKGKFLAQRIRTWLILQHTEQEIAAGTARQSQMRPIDDNSLRSYLQYPHSTVFDTRITSTIEVVQLRGRFLGEIEAIGSVSGKVKLIIDRFQIDIEKWFVYWDALYQEHDFAVECFQRQSLNLQKDYAFIIVCSAIISKLGRELAQGTAATSLTKEMSETVEITVDRIIKQLIFISQSDSYRWHLQWAPTYSALMVAFIAALALRLASFRCHIIDWPALLNAATNVAHILEEHPHRSFSVLIQNLLRVSPGASCSALKGTTGSTPHAYRNADSDHISHDGNHGAYMDSYRQNMDGVSTSHLEPRSTAQHTQNPKLAQPDPPIPQGSFECMTAPSSIATETIGTMLLPMQQPFRYNSLYNNEQGLELSSATLSWMFDYDSITSCLGNSEHESTGFFDNFSPP